MDSHDFRSRDCVPAPPGLVATTVSRKRLQRAFVPQLHRNLTLHGGQAVDIKTTV